MSGHSVRARLLLLRYSNGCSLVDSAKGLLAERSPRQASCQPLLRAQLTRSRKAAYTEGKQEALRENTRGCCFRDQGDSKPIVTLSFCPARVLCPRAARVCSMQPQDGPCRVIAPVDTASAPCISVAPHGPCMPDKTCGRR